jgi:septal ring factor EnvC (AmiA/AmiB activator)
MLVLTGCASVSTFMHETGDLTSGRTAQMERDAQANQDVALARNASLRDQLASLNSQSARLKRQLGTAGAELRKVNARLAQNAGATQAQRDDYRRLADQQRNLQRQLDTARSAPPPANASAIAEQKAELDRLSAEKDVLERQVAALNEGL